MRPHNYEYQHEGLRRAKAEGKAEGKGEGRAESLIDVLTARGFTLTEAQRARILPETDQTRLRAWLARAISTSSVDAVFTD